MEAIIERPKANLAALIDIKAEKEAEKKFLNGVRKKNLTSALKCGIPKGRVRVEVRYDNAGLKKKYKIDW